MCASIQKGAKAIKDKEWGYFMKGGLIDDELEIPEHWKENEKDYRTIITLTQTGYAFDNIQESLDDPEKIEEWLTILNSPTPELEKLPSIFEDKLSTF